MPTVTIDFEKCVQDSQEYGSDDEHMVSRVFFSITVGGKSYSGLSADVKQTVGADFETDPLEVTAPQKYSGPFNWHAFQRCVEGYYRSTIGGSGTGILIRGATNIRMQGNEFTKRARCSFEASENSAAWG